jgi:hypothetical protein
MPGLVSHEAEKRAAHWLAAWYGHGIHRTATAGDRAGADRLTGEARSLGAAVSIEEFALDRLDPVTAFLETNAGLRAGLISAFEANREPREPSPHVEQQIYDRFISDADNKLMNSFHEASWPDRLSIIEPVPGCVCYRNALSQRARSCGTPLGSRPRVGPPRSLSSSSGVPRFKTAGDVPCSRISGPIHLSHVA